VHLELYLRHATWRPFSFRVSVTAAIHVFYISGEDAQKRLVHLFA